MIVLFIIITNDVIMLSYSPLSKCVTKETNDNVLQTW